MPARIGVQRCEEWRNAQLHLPRPDLGCRRRFIPFDGLKEGTFLYFSSNVSGNQDIYRSKPNSNGSFGAPSPVVELNTEFDDRMPNVRSDGLEIVFSSTRPTDAKGTAAFGSFDVYVATRSSTNKPFSAPVNLGANVNTAGSETRSTISWDHRRLYFGRDGEIQTANRKKKSN